MDERHTGENIKTRLLELAKVWKIAGKVTGVVHDNASNMTLAMNLLGAESDWDHQACVGDTLQLTVHAGLNESSTAKMLSIARKIVGHFNHSAIACSNLHKVQEQNGKKTQSCARRVNKVEFHIPYAQPSHLREHCSDDSAGTVRSQPFEAVRFPMGPC